MHLTTLLHNEHVTKCNVSWNVVSWWCKRMHCKALHCCWWWLSADLWSLRHWQLVALHSVLNKTYVTLHNVIYITQDSITLHWSQAFAIGCTSLACFTSLSIVQDSVTCQCTQVEHCTTLNKTLLHCVDHTRLLSDCTLKYAPENTHGHWLVTHC